jgi:hypothetical protein
VYLVAILAFLFSLGVYDFDITSTNNLKTLDRNLEPVIIQGSAFLDFASARIGNTGELFLYAFQANGGVWQQIPFQFDERDAANNYFNRTGDETVGLDANDELIFMARDAGDQALSSWIDDENSKQFVRYEIKITNPLATDKVAWVYLYRSNTLTLSPNLTDYISYFKSTTSDIAADKVSSIFYEITNAKNGFPKDLIIPVPAGGSGVDLLDVLKFRAKASLVVNISIDEDDILFQASKSDSIRAKDGRVRVIRELEATLKADLPFPLPDQEFDFRTAKGFYYPYSANLEIGIPHLSDVSVSEGRMSIDLNATAASPNMKFVSANNVGPFNVDGAANETVNKEIDNVLPGGNWIYINGSQGTLVHRFPLEKTVGGKRELYFKDNSSNDSGDTGDKKSYGDTGVFLRDGISTPFTLKYQGYFLDKDRPSDIGSQIALNEQNPLQIDAAPQDFGAVPVELVAFTAAVEGQDVQLAWITATETNNYGFDIERKTGDDEWMKLAFVAGHGTTTTPRQYEYLDRNLPSGAYEYRLKQIDTDGSFEYSPIVTALVGVPERFTLAQNFPNPFNPVTEIQYELPGQILENGKTPRTVLKIYNILGSEVRTLVDEEQSPGFYHVSWDATDDRGQRLPSGVYIYRLQAGKFVATRKMVFVQ